MVSAIFKATDILAACKAFRRASEIMLPEDQYTRSDIDVYKVVKETYKAFEGRIRDLMTLSDIIMSNSINGNICLEDADILLLAQFLLPRSDT